MECFNCGSSSIFQIFDEIFKCPHCEEEIHIGYYGCNECGGIWYANGEEMINGMVMDHDGFIEEQSEFIRSLAESIKDPSALAELIEKGDLKPIEFEEDCMGELINKCIKCNKIAYEINEGIYRCSDDECGFEWEVIKCG